MKPTMSVALTLLIISPQIFAAASLRCENIFESTTTQALNVISTEASKEEKVTELEGARGAKFVTEIKSKSGEIFKVDDEIGIRRVYGGRIPLVTFSRGKIDAISADSKIILRSSDGSRTLFSNVTGQISKKLSKDDNIKGFSVGTPVKEFFGKPTKLYGKYTFTSVEGVIKELYSDGTALVSDNYGDTTLHYIMNLKALPKIKAVEHDNFSNGLTGTPMQSKSGETFKLKNKVGIHRTTMTWQGPKTKFLTGIIDEILKDNKFIFLTEKGEEILLSKNDRGLVKKIPDDEYFAGFTAGVHVIRVYETRDLFLNKKIKIYEGQIIALYSDGTALVKGNDRITTVHNVKYLHVKSDK